MIAVLLPRLHGSGKTVHSLVAKMRQAKLQYLQYAYPHVVFLA